MEKESLILYGYFQKFTYQLSRFFKFIFFKNNRSILVRYISLLSQELLDQLQQCFWKIVFRGQRTSNYWFLEIHFLGTKRAMFKDFLRIFWRTNNPWHFMSIFKNLRTNYLILLLSRGLMDQLLQSFWKIVFRDQKTKHFWFLRIFFFKRAIVKVSLRIFF